MRALPDEKSEMVSMLLFGECYEILRSDEGWHQVSSEYDGYLGWITDSVVHLISEEEYRYLAEESRTLIKPSFIVTDECPEHPFMLFPGSSLPVYRGNSFVLGEEKFISTGPFITNDDRINPFVLVQQTAMLFLNAPYLWGGRSLFGVDCSGFVQVVFKTAGIRLPRDAGQQAKIGKTISLREARSGDIAFFGYLPGKITHTGIFLDDGQLIHASGKVRINAIDERGIYSAEKKQITHTLQLIKRVIL